MYEDYMPNMLGGNFYPYQNTYEQNCDCYNQFDGFYDMPQNYYNRGNFMQSASIDLEELYPEIYRIVYPMVKKICNNVSRSINEDLLEEMTKEIYSNLEAENIININVNVEDNNMTNRSSSVTSNVKKQTPVENRANESRQFNPIRDLIKILLLRELIGRPGFGSRPPFPGPRPKPPFPGQRPPIPPRPRY